MNTEELDKAQFGHVLHQRPKDAIQLPTVNDLKAFEQRVAEIFNRGEIRAPVHLAGGNEHELREIFTHVHPQDWILTTWRSHYHCLLKGVPLDRLMADIKAGRSITLCYPEYRILSSAIVGGILPIAVGLAWSIKRRGGSEKVWAFIGDMTANTGICFESISYAAAHKLPLRVVKENNRKSVCTDTLDVWPLVDHSDFDAVMYEYKYVLPWPHSGAGKRVEF